MRPCYAEVALPPPVARQLTYGLPAELEEVRPGALVLVPVGRRLVTGVVVGVSSVLAEGLRQDQLRKVERLLDEALLDPEIIELCRWMAGYYLAPLGSALAAALPPGVRLNSGRLVRLLSQAPAQEGGLEGRIAQALAQDGPLKVSALQRRFGREGLERSLYRLRRQGRVEIVPVLQEGRGRARWEQRLRLADPEQARQALPLLEGRAPRQAACLRHLLSQASCSRQELLGAGFSAPVLNGLVERGLVERFAGERARDPLAHIEAEEGQALRLNADQQQVLEPLAAALDRGVFYPALLQGVTGSGKTLIYIHLVARALEQGKGALVLVPEIALAWQMVRLFKARFGDKVAVLHSQLSAGERYDTWRRLRRGEQQVVVGARSAILAPVQNLGLIAVDEEHDGAYKQEDLESRQRIAYNARDLALVRGQRRNAVVVLGSATPSLESYWNAQTGKYHRHLLPRRVDDRPLPRVELVDMKKEPFQRKQRAIFSRALRLKMRQRLERGEKIVLLQNRRGYAPFIACAACGEAVRCASCRVCLTFHRGQAPLMRCHYCGFAAPPPLTCPACGSGEWRFEGIGTQKVESALLEQFPGVRVIRMDVDTTGWKGAHDELVERFRRGEAEVLLGTQMVAKGLDFPQVTLVGVISADTGMHLPDFRAAERCFQLLTQVAGRSGRGAGPGEVVIQTLLPEDPVLLAAAGQDFEAFARRELEERREAGFPPFGRLVVFRWQGKEEEAVERAAQQGAGHLRTELEEGAQVLGPSPAPLARLRGQYRWQALLRGDSARRLQGTASRALPAMQETAQGQGVALTINVDPLAMM